MKVMYNFYNSGQFVTLTITSLWKFLKDDILNMQFQFCGNLWKMTFSMCSSHLWGFPIVGILKKCKAKCI